MSNDNQITRRQAVATLGTLIGAPSMPAAADEPERSRTQYVPYLAVLGSLSFVMLTFGSVSFAQDEFHGSGSSSRCADTRAQIESEYEAKVHALDQQQRQLEHDDAQRRAGCATGDPGKQCRDDAAKQFVQENERINAAVARADADRKKALRDAERTVCARAGAPNKTDKFDGSESAPVRRPWPYEDSHITSPPAGKADSDNPTDLTCVDDAIVGVTIFRGDDGINFLQIDCATVVNTRQGTGWTWTEYRPGPGAGGNATGTRIPIVCPQGYVVAGVRASLDPGEDHVRDLTLECALIAGAPKGHLGKFGTLGSNFPAAAPGRPNGKGTGAFSRTSQTAANRRREPRTWASRIPMTTGPQVMIQSPGYGAASIVAGLRNGWMGGSTVHSIAIKAAGGFITKSPN